MHHIPHHMKQPTDCDEGIGLKTLIRTKRYEPSEGKLPDAKPTAEISDSAPPIMIALKFLRLGSRMRDDATMYKAAMMSGGMASSG
jgi:hypothetical protein